MYNLLSPSKAIATPHGMEIYATRLASFDIAQPTTKRKRASGAKGAKALRWLHKSPSPADLARAGFFYAPTISCPDNVTCFVCEKGLDGWEEEDDPVKEHLNYSPECGWAINMAIEQEVDEGIREDEDPMSAKMLEARKSTFGDRWPHKNKRGWTCKVQKMIEAGWYHCPTAESDDFVKCAYCNLSLDGWEPKDKPFEEHQRRSPDCAFFTLSQSMNVKPARAKQGRPSKASRMSTQSNVTAALEDLSMLDTAAEEGDSIATAATNMTTASAASKVGRRIGTAKIRKGKSRSKAIKAALMEESTQNSSFVEPEDDDFEVKVHTDSLEDHRGTKRPSSEMEAIDPPLEGAAKTAKRRATRTRSSTIRPQMVPDHAESFEAVSDMHMTDTKGMPPPTLPLLKKGGKPGRTRGSSTGRKASNMSTASKASLRGVPTDTEIDAALEADLNRPLTDDDAEEGEACRGPKSRRLTRNRPESKQVSASVAPARESTHISTLSVEDDQVEVRVEILNIFELDAALGTIDENLHSISTSLQEEHSMTTKTKTRKPKGQAKVSITPNALKRQDVSRVEQEHSTVHQPTSIEVEVMAPGNNEGNKANTKNGDVTQEFTTKKRSAARSKLKQLDPCQPSCQLTGRGKAESLVSTAKAPVESQLDMETSVLTTKVAADELLYESDTNTMAEAPLRPGSKKGKASKKGETLKKVDSPQRFENTPPISTKRAEEDPVPIAPRNVDFVKGEAAVGTSVPLAFTADFETRTKAREGSVEQPNAAQEAEVSKPKPGRGRPKGKASCLSSCMMEKQDERTPEPHALPSQGPPITAVGAVETFASSTRLTDTFSPTLQPPTPKPVVPSPTPSPQSSDAENQPPSSRPSQQCPPLFETSPSRPHAERIPLAASTPDTSPSRRNVASVVQTTFPWTAIDIENILLGSPEAARPLPQISMNGLMNCLSSPERKMTVEEWIHFNAEKGEEDLRNECERLVGKFEGEGNRALRALEGVTSTDS
ncbi:hypothetical protein MMC17_004043 [Xylographa soralifera]|nr:hypothetical protein [Xylographa soralifera]